MTKHENTVKALLADVRAVEPSKQNIAFHLNSKLAELVSAGCGEHAGWLTRCGDFVGELPMVAVRCGERGIMIDPWRASRRIFATIQNRTGEPLEKAVRNMWESCDWGDQKKEVGRLHGNLLEILEGCGVVREDSVDDFYVNALGDKMSPAREMAIFLEELEGEELVYPGTKRDVPGGVAFERRVGRDFTWEDSRDGLWLVMDGYHSVCRWPVYVFDQGVVVVQTRNAVHTSVTNLAEDVLEAVQSRWGNKKRCFEFYQRWSGDDLSKACEIIRGDGERRVRWGRTDLSDVPGLAGWLAQL